MELENTDELLYLEKDSHIFVASQGENYDGNVALEAFKIYELLGEVIFIFINKDREASDQFTEQLTCKHRMR